MKIIIAGTRTLHPSPEAITAELAAAGWAPTIILCGCAPGADEAGLLWAEANNIEVIEMPANWFLHGKSAGPRRNRDMALLCDAALVFWDGASRGSANLIETMDRLAKPVRVVRMASPDTPHPRRL